MSSARSHVRPNTRATPNASGPWCRSRIGALAEDAQLAPSLVGDPVDGASRATAHLLGAQRLYKILPLHLAELPIQCADAHPAPVADVRLLGVASDLVAVTRAVRQQAKYHQSR